MTLVSTSDDDPMITKPAAWKALTIREARPSLSRRLPVRIRLGGHLSVRVPQSAVGVEASMPVDLEPRRMVRKSPIGCLVLPEIYWGLCRDRYLDHDQAPLSPFGYRIRPSAWLLSATPSVAVNRSTSKSI